MDKHELFNSTLFFFSNVIDKAHELTRGLELGELTKVQYKIVELVYFSPNLTPSQVNQCLDFSMPNTSREISKLELKGLLTKKADSLDKRKVYLALSDSGLTLMEHVIAQIKQNFFNVTPHFSEDEINELLSAMQTIKSKLL